jgi:hypothetical protein
MDEIKPLSPTSEGLNTGIGGIGAGEGGKGTISLKLHLRRGRSCFDCRAPKGCR